MNCPHRLLLGICEFKKKHRCHSLHLLFKRSWTWKCENDVFHIFTFLIHQASPQATSPYICSSNFLHPTHWSWGTLSPTVGMVVTISASNTSDTRRWCCQPHWDNVQKDGKTKMLLNILHIFSLFSYSLHFFFRSAPNFSRWQKLKTFPSPVDKCLQEHCEGQDHFLLQWILPVQNVFHIPLVPNVWGQTLLNSMPSELEVGEPVCELMTARSTHTWAWCNKENQGSSTIMGMS